MLLGIVAIIITSALFLLYQFDAKSWYSVWDSRWRTKTNVHHHSSGDIDKSRMGASESSERLKASEPQDTDNIEGSRPPPSRDGPIDTTPRARPASSGQPSVPSLALEAGVESDEEDDLSPRPSFPAANSAQRASGPADTLSERREPPKLKPLSNGRPTDTQLMPPPRLGQTRLGSPSTGGGLQVPRAGPVPNRGPPGRSSASSLAPPPYKVTNMRQKVTLTPGHSPLDWAALQKSNKNLSGVNSLVRVTPSQLKSMNGRKGRPAWSSYQGKVYNISPYLPYHPGGEGELRRAAGKDGEKLFLEVHPWVNWDNMLGECMVGILVSESDTSGPVKGSLDDMD